MSDQATLPFNAQFQGMLLKVLLAEERDFANAVVDYVEPHYFQDPVCAWAWDQAKKYRQAYGALPTLAFLNNVASQQPPQNRDLLLAGIGAINDQVPSDESAIKDRLLDFIRRNVFRQAFVDTRDLFNAGSVDAAYDLMQERMDALRNVGWENENREWLAEGFIDRHIRRQDTSASTRAISTGIPDLDKVFGGDGLHQGELGIWIAGKNVGKTSWLINLSLSAVRTQLKKSLHCVIEGNLNYIANRYDTILAGEAYGLMKGGDVDPVNYAKAVQEIQYLKGLCCIKDCTATAWEVNVTHIDGELKKLKKKHGFVPDLIAIDYVDLMRARTAQDSEMSHQKQAVQDLKSLAGRGYAIWTASQGQRPKGEDYKNVQSILTSNQIADCYSKVRIADFVGSLNQTIEERRQGVMRLYAELYRDGPAEKEILINADFTRMKFGPSSGVPMPGPIAQSGQYPNGAVKKIKPIAYVQKHNGV